MGTDTCGSIRVPAARQNLVGLRGTRGLSSRTDVMPMSDTQDYLAKHPGAGVTSLGEILERGLHHEALDQTLRLRNTLERRDSEHYRQALIKRRALKEAVLSTLDGQTTRCARVSGAPAQAGAHQRGPRRRPPARRCRHHLPAERHDGPARDVDAGRLHRGRPARRTRDAGRRVRRTDPAALRLRLGAGRNASPCALQQPPLVNGTAPAPRSAIVKAGTAPDGAVARLTYHPTTGALEYDVTIAGDARVVGVALHRPEGDRPGPIIAHLVARGQRAGRGVVTLRARDREDFGAGRVFLRLYTERLPLGTAPVRVSLP